MCRCAGSRGGGEVGGFRSLSSRSSKCTAGLCIGSCTPRWACAWRIIDCLAFEWCEARGQCISSRLNFCRHAIRGLDGENEYGSTCVRPWYHIHDCQTLACYPLQEPARARTLGEAPRLSRSELLSESNIEVLLSSTSAAALTYREKWEQLARVLASGA